MSKAYCLIKHEPHYRYEAFIAGLRAAGFNPSEQPPGAITGDDVLVIWNRYWGHHAMATRFEQIGARVIVAENGYFGVDANGIQHYAIARSGHNGSGQWFPRGPDRLDALKLRPLPWRDSEQGYILVCGQRGIGSPTMASPPGWHDDVARRLRKLTSREIRIRYHPGDRNAPKNPRSLEEDLAGGAACVIWSSSSGVQALLRGVPVFYEAPRWICERGARQGIHEINRPLRDDMARMEALREMSWAQWSVDEITSGMPFRHLLS